MRQIPLPTFYLDAYYYQVQGQLHITRQSYCLFAVWTESGLKVERIERDDDFWKSKMEEKLTKFYNNFFIIIIILFFYNSFIGHLELIILHDV